MTKEQQQKAIEAIEAAEKLGVGDYWEWGYTSGQIRKVGPCCAVGHLAWAVGIHRLVGGNGALVADYGLSAHQEGQLARLNDTTAESERKQAVIDFLRSLPTED